MFKSVCIIGFGLIGSSIARVLRRDSLAETIICADASKDVCRRALDLGIADRATDNLTDGVKGCDLVILAVPVGAYSSVTRAIAPVLQDGVILTDVGSVKQAVVSAVTPHLPSHAHFIPAHPIAGTEHSGPDAGFAELFQDRWSIITPLPGADAEAVEKVKALWQACGARIEIMEPKRHDLVLAITSHLPHLIAYTIVGTATDLEEHTKEDVIKFSASGFRDFTRIAASDPVMWRDIFINNRDAVLEIVQRFTEDLTALQRAIRWGDGDALQDMFTRTRAIRRQVIEAGQAADASKSTQSPAGSAQPADRHKESGSAA